MTVLPIGQDELGQWSDEVARAGDAASWSVTGDRSRPHLAAGSIWRTNASRDASLPVVAGVFRCTVLPHGWRGVGRLNGQMVLVGGWGPSWPHVSHSEIWTSSDGQGWNRLPDAPRGGRSTHHTVVFQNRMWVMAGQEISFVDEAENEVLYNDVWSSADGREWRLETGEAAWSPRGQIGGSVVFDDRMWIIGGGTYDNRRYYSDIWSSGDGVNWTLELAEAPWTPRQYHETVVFDDKMWVIGGWSMEGNLNDVWFSEDDVTWTELVDAPWPSRHAAAVFVHREALWLVAGDLWNDVWRLGPTSAGSQGAADLSLTVSE
ncbi:MAG: hypothetical protein ACI8TP_003291 [Acidimicrobiales bacterium]